MKRGPKIKLRTRDGETIKENSNYYVVDKKARFPNVMKVKTKEYPTEYGIRHKHIPVIIKSAMGDQSAWMNRLTMKSEYVFAHEQNAKRYLNRLLKSKIRAARREFMEYLDKVGKLL